jgi:hypothetical protein
MQPQAPPQSGLAVSVPVPENMTRTTSQRKPASCGKRESVVTNASYKTSSGLRKTRWGGKKRTTLVQIWPERDFRRKKKSRDDVIF